MSLPTMYMSFPTTCRRKTLVFQWSIRPSLLLWLCFYSINFTSCHAKPISACTSSCGKLNIKNPFRVQTDSEKCGSKRYEVYCENNVAMVSLYSGNYSVEAINYKNYTMRLVDPAFHQQNYSFLPLYPRPLDRIDYQYRFVPGNDLVVYLTCVESVNDHGYVNTSPCISTEHAGVYNYVYVGYLTAKELRIGCTVKSVALTSEGEVLRERLSEGYISCADIHKSLGHGFVLGWWGTSGRPSRFATGTYMLMNALLYYIGLLHAAKVTFGTPCVIILLIYKWRRRHLSMYNTIEEFLQNNNNLMPIRYSYSEIKRMTKGFKNKLDQGGFGTVFKGKLRSGHMVAVKMLSKSKANGHEFISEVATIGRIHHVNVVQLVGYCVEGSNRALVYDFMSNSSLDKHIFPKKENISLRCMEIYEIAIQIARGMAYLHQGCDIQILHFDIKPHNILLDEDFTAKISDFGLAKLYPTNESIVALTAARGTIGYMALELFYKNIGGVSYKADVYSFGMLLLEMAGKRRNLNPFAENSSQIHFPSWAYDQLMTGNELEIVDANEEEKELAKKMMIVAFWCIQMRPSDRPSMKKGVEMFESEVDCLEMAPKPFLSVEDLPSEHASIHPKSTELSSIQSCSSLELESKSKSLILNSCLGYME